MAKDSQVFLYSFKIATSLQVYPDITSLPMALHKEEAVNMVGNATSRGLVVPATSKDGQVMLVGLPPRIINMIQASRLQSGTAFDFNRYLRQPARMELRAAEQTGTTKLATFRANVREPIGQSWQEDIRGFWTKHHVLCTEDSILLAPADRVCLVEVIF